MPKKGSKQGTPMPKFPSYPVPYFHLLGTQAAFIHPLGSTRGLHLSSASAFLPYKLNQTGALRRVGVCKFCVELLHGKGQSTTDGPKKREKQCATPGTHSRPGGKPAPYWKPGQTRFFSLSLVIFCSAPSGKISHLHPGCRIPSLKS